MRFYFALILVALWATSARAIEPADSYPYPDPYLATATLSILSDDGATLGRPIDHRPRARLRGRNNLLSLQGHGA